MRISVNKAHFPITVLGPGRRIGIWLQGCSIRCAGCISRDTWHVDSSYECDIETILGWCQHVTSNRFDGVTISGGEPFDQAEALCVLVEQFHYWRERDQLDFDLLAYSGYGLKHLMEDHSKILLRLDAIIPEPFQQESQKNLIWRGSANQSIIPLSEKGRRLYADKALQGKSAERKIQMMVDEQSIWFAGIPHKGDFDRLATKCATMGVDFNNCSWRP